MTVPADRRPFRDRLAAGETLLLDGAVGTELDRRGVPTTLPLWSAIGVIERPEMVRQIHADYVAAGCDIVIANTFRTTGRTVRKTARDNLDLVSLNETAVRLAREAMTDAAREVYLAGSLAPLEDCYSPWLSPPPEIALAEHREQAVILAAAGCDLLMVETMPCIREAAAATTAAFETGLPVTTGFVTGDDGRLLSGESLDEAVAALAGLPIAALFINCVSLMAIEPALAHLRSLTRLPIGGYANLGIPEATTGWAPNQSIDGARYAAHVARWLDLGVQIVGGCCGTEPRHIAAVRRLLDGEEAAR